MEAETVTSAAELTWAAAIKGTILSVDFADPMVLVLILFHFASLIFMIMTRKHIYISSFYFLFVVVLISATPKLNLYMMANWEKIGFNYCYFDETYMFLYVFWAFPLVIDCIILILFMIFDGLYQYIYGRKKIIPGYNNNVQ